MTIGTPSLVALLVLAACRHDDQARPPAELDSYLADLAGADPSVRSREVATWRLDEPAWRRIVVEPYRGLYADYARAFDAAVPRLVAALESRGAIAVRAHYAGDPLLTAGQARARWALPVAFGSSVATLAGSPIDAVFVRDGEHWHAIAGLDDVIRTRVGALDPACGALLELASPPPRCRDIAWEIADSALRTDRGRFAHACSLAASVCGKPSP